MDWISRSTYAYPALESMHIVGVALLLGSLVVFELRVWGAGVAIDLDGLSRLALPVTLAGFALAAASGLLLFAADPAEMLRNRAFVIKMGLLLLAGLNAIWFHERGGLAARDRLGRWQTAFSLGLWVAVIVCGRWIAYK